MKTLSILGLKVNKVIFDEALKTIESFVKNGGKHLVVTPYSESIVAAQSDEEFRRIINEASLSVPDGGGLLAAAEFLSRSLSNNRILRFFEAIFYGLNVGFKLTFNSSSFINLKERVSGADLVVSLCQISQQKGYRVYFLGGHGNSTKQASENLQKKFPRLKIESSAGPTDLKVATDEEIRQIVSSINRFNPDFLFVAFRPVEQEKWLYHHLSRIDAKVFMAVGGAFDMISGQKKRAPIIFQRLNLEWLWRLLIEPSRLPRIFTAVIVFPWLVFKYNIGGKN